MASSSRARRIRCRADDTSSRSAAAGSVIERAHTCITAHVSVMRAARREALRCAALSAPVSATPHAHGLLTRSLTLMLHTAGTVLRGSQAAGSHPAQGRCSRPHVLSSPEVARHAGWGHRSCGLHSDSTRRRLAVASTGTDGPAAHAAAVTWGPAPDATGAWATTSRWVVFSDLHVSARSLDVCLAVLDQVRGLVLGALQAFFAPGAACLLARAGECL